MGSFFSLLYAKISGLAGFFILLAIAFFAALWFFGTDLACWVFEQIMSIAVSALNGFNVDFSIFNPAQYISALPSEITNIFGLLGLGQALAILLSAVIIRITLQLIPFTRLGS